MLSGGVLERVVPVVQELEEGIALAFEMGGYDVDVGDFFHRDANEAVCCLDRVGHK